ncbi:MAG: hypothetical protein AB7O69_17440 [Burkholderiales bacterium]
MLGWEIFVHRQLPGESLENPSNESRLATWRTSIGGLDWLDKLVKEGKAVDLGGNGYPCRFTAAAKEILPRISRGVPAHTGPAVIGDDYYLPAGWSEKVQLDRAKVLECPPDAQLVIEAWDQS